MIELGCKKDRHTILINWPNSHLPLNHKNGEHNIWPKETMLVNILTSLSRKISMILIVKLFIYILYFILSSGPMWYLYIL